jgi:hypothetical protein
MGPVGVSGAHVCGSFGVTLTHTVRIMSHTPWNLARGEPLELHIMMMAATSMQPVENLSAIHHPSSITRGHPSCVVTACACRDCEGET